jgi:hypothetical protein
LVVAAGLSKSREVIGAGFDRDSGSMVCAMFLVGVTGGSVVVFETCSTCA